MSSIGIINKHKTIQVWYKEKNVEEEGFVCDTTSVDQEVIGKREERKIIIYDKE